MLTVLADDQKCKTSLITFPRREIRKGRKITRKVARPGSLKSSLAIHSKTLHFTRVASCVTTGKRTGTIRARSKLNHRGDYRNMARFVAHIGRSAMKTLVSHGRNDLFGGVAQSKTFLIATRSITTTQSLRTERWYTDKHEWITVDGKLGTIGISDYAQEALGDVVYAQLPDVGSMVKKEEECGALESVKAASELISPVSGKVVEKNEAVESKPSLINSSCYKEGWLFKVELNDIDEIKSLMNEEAYNTFLKSDAH